jgi:endonuclease YncB( thermonuclease family)
MIRALISLFVVFVVTVATLVAIDLYGPASASITVIDGDTVERAGVRHRLIGIDAPEISEAQCQKERALGRTAAQRLREMIETAGKVDLWPEGTRRTPTGASFPI